MAKADKKMSNTKSWSLPQFTLNSMDFIKFKLTAQNLLVLFNLLGRIFSASNIKVTFPLTQPSLDFKRKFPPNIFYSSLYLLRKETLRSLHLYGSLSNFEFALLMKSFENSTTL